MAAAEDYLRDVGGTDAFSQSVYDFLKKEDEYPREAGNKDQRRPESYEEDIRQKGRDSNDADATAKIHRVSAPMGALLGLAEQLENMLKEEGAKGWTGNAEALTQERASSQNGVSEFRDVGVDPNSAQLRHSSGEDWRSSGSQDGRRKPLSETSYQQILDQLRQNGLSPQKNGTAKLRKRKGEEACLRMYEVALQKIVDKQREEERQAIEDAQQAKRRGFKAHKRSRQIAEMRLKNANPIDYSKMLYNEAKQIEKKKAALLEALEAERKKELEQCTFSPSITPFLPLYTARHAHEPVVERMQKMVQEQKDRIQQMREEAEKAKAKELTFKPTISRSFSPTRTGASESFLKRTREYLWQKQVAQERLQEAIEAEASVKSVPSINSCSKQITREEPVHQRLYRSARLREQQVNEDQENRSRAFETTRLRSEQEILESTGRLFSDQEQKQRKLDAAARAQLERSQSLAAVKKINNTSVEYAKRKLEKDVRAAFAEVDPECSGIVGQAEIRSVFQKLNVFHKPGVRKNRERERAEQTVLDRARALMPGREGIGVDTQAFLGFMELVLEHSLQQQKASLQTGPTESERDLPDGRGINHDLDPLRKLAREIARCSFHRLAYTQTKVLRETKSNCPPNRVLEAKASSHPLTFSPKLSRPSDLSASLPITSQIDRSKSTFRWQSRTGELALVPFPGEAAPRLPTRAGQDAHARDILRKGERARERIERLRLELELREREACTFQPRLVASPRKVQSARERRTSVRQGPSPPSALLKELSEMGECTFHPKTTARPSNRKVVVKPPALFDRCIERMRRAHARRQQLVLWQEARIPQSLKDRQRVYKRKETRTKPEPFNFVPVKKRTPLVYVEVILSKSRVARIGVQQGEQPEKIAADFAKIYDLDDEARDHLTNVIRKSVDDILAQKAAQERLQEGLKQAQEVLDRKISEIMHRRDHTDGTEHASDGVEAATGDGPNKSLEQQWTVEESSGDRGMLSAKDAANDGVVNDRGIDREDDVASLSDGLQVTDL